MLDNQLVINKFKKLLSQEKNYADSFNFDIDNFLDLNGDWSFYKSFFASFDKLEEVEKWLNLVKSKIVLHEEEDDVENIIAEYIDLQTTNKQILFLKK